MTNHEPWVGDSYSAGIEGQKVLVCGFSHYGEHDSANFTKDVVTQWALNGGIPFFDSIMRYFGFSDRREFWSKVSFANSLPSIVGGTEAMYASGTEQQRAAVPTRIKSILSDLEPDKALVFTKKGWSLWPDYDDGKGSRFLTIPETEEIEYGTYTGDRFSTVAYGLRHPQFASFETMRRTVDAIMAHDPA